MSEDFIQKKHIIVDEIIHKQLSAVKPRGVNFNFLLQYLLIEAGLLAKDDPNLIVAYEYLKSKMKNLKQSNDAKFK